MKNNISINHTLLDLVSSFNLNTLDYTWVYFGFSFSPCEFQESVLQMNREQYSYIFRFIAFLCDISLYLLLVYLRFFVILPVVCNKYSLLLIKAHFYLIYSFLIT